MKTKLLVDMALAAAALLIVPGLQAQEAAVCPPLSSAPLIDGKLDRDQEAWAKALQCELRLKDGSAPVTNTAFIGTCAGKLYIGFYCRDPRPGLLPAVCTNRDDDAIWQDPCFEIFIRPTRVTQTYYHLAANALGAQWDGFDQQGSEWNVQWEAKGQQAPGGWSVEAAIPFKELVFEENPPAGWGLNFCYTRKGDAEKGINPEYYTWQGWFHKPESWQTVCFAGLNLPALYGARTGFIPNGSFEDGLQDWQPTNAAELVRTPTGRGISLRGGEILGKLSCPPWPVNPYVGATLRWAAQVKTGKAGEIVLEGCTETGGDYALRVAVPCASGQWTQQAVDLYTQLVPLAFTNRPKQLSFKTIRLRGEMTLDWVALEGNGFGFAFPDWDGRFKQSLAPGIRWILAERLRILWGLPMTVHHLRPQWDDPALFPRFLDAIQQAEMNVVIVNGSEVWWDNPLAFYRDKAALIAARQRGLRVGFRVGYVKSRAGLELRAFTNVKGEKPLAHKVYCPCLLDERLWKSQLEAPANRLLDWLKTENIKPAEFLDIIAYDNEHIPNREHCFCEDCVQAFLKSKQAAFTKDPAAPVDVWLRHKGLYDEFKNWQEVSLAKILAGVRDRIRQRHPTVLFMFYYYKHEEWACRAQLKGLGTPELPAIAFMDKCYWSGYAGAPQLVNTEFKAMQACLGYTPLHAPAIDFYTAPPYPAYTPRRAGQELYLLARAGPAAVMYGEDRGKAEDIFQAYQPYLEAFRKANEYLAEEGVISLRRNPPDANLAAKLERARANAEALISRQWLEGNALGPNEFSSDNEPVRTLTAGRVRLTKSCDGLAQGANTCDPIHNAQKSDYTFNLLPAAAGRAAGLTLVGASGLWERARIIVWVNGEKIAALRGKDLFTAAWKEARINVPIPAGKLKTKNVITIGYVDGDDFRFSLGDTYLRLKELSLEWNE